MKARFILRHWPWWAVAVFAVVFGIWMVGTIQQWQTLRWIERGGGDYFTKSGVATKLVPPPIQRWLNVRFGKRWSAPFDSVTNISLGSVEVSASDLAHLGRLQNLEALHLRGTNVSDDLLLEYLGAFSQLRTLNLGETPVGDRGIRVLRELPNLEQLRLNHTKVTDAGLLHLRECERLRELILAKCQITDIGLSHLRQCHELRALNLDGTRISDAGLIHLKNLSNLEILFISSNGITDKGMIHLEELSNLKKLFVVGTRVTNAERAWLKKALPSLEVVPAKAPPVWPEALPGLEPIGGI